MPRTTHKPSDTTRHHVELLAGRGVPQTRIAKYLGISRPTLVKHYRQELDDGLQMANVRIAGALFKLTQEGNVAAAIFWLKAQGMWREHQEPLDTQPSKPETSDLSDLEVARRIAFALDKFTVSR